MPIVKRAPHVCDLPSETRSGHGAVWECDECGRRWICRLYPNPAYSGWRRTWPDIFGGRWWRHSL